jgi:hypothetical protein
MESAEGAVAAAEQHLRQGEPLLAYNATQQGLERSPGHGRLRQLQALALARSGDVERANTILSELAAGGLDDAETLGMLARTHKDLALRTSGVARAAHLRSGFELYERAYRAALERGEPDAAGYTGINAATMAVLRGDIAQARELAAQVRAAARGGAATNDYWTEATLGEAALILGQAAAAREHYGRAARIAGRRYGDLATTRKQARLLESHLPPADGRASEALSIPPVVVFSGHMIDAPGRAEPRFPPTLEPEVRASIRAKLAQLAPAAVYGSAACGADLLCLEAARELGCETHVVLPFPAPAFRAASVDYAGGEWGARFERVLAAADSVTIASDHHARGSAATFEYANLILTGMARLRGRVLETPVRALAVRDPRSPGIRGGTASIVSLWERHGLEPDTIEVKAARTAAASGSSDGAPAEAAPAHGIRHEMRALLFADAVGYSRFTEDQIPLYITEFLGAVATLGRSSRHRFEHVETAGDGLYMVFGDVRDAAHFALELSALAGGTDWVARGLPPGFNLRIALHCGPVHCGRDPLTDSAIYTGPHTSRAARIEPITPPGQVYASQAFAAVAAARDAGELDLRYVGPVSLAKAYGALPLYHLAADR